MKENIEDRIKTRSEITEIVKGLRSHGKKIVTTNGSFDILHAGHVAFLQEAKAQGDVLFVGVNSNGSVRRWKKIVGNPNWEKRPLIDEKDRALMVAAIRFVDYVEIFNETDCIAFVGAIKPDVHVNGSEYGENCIEAETVKKYGGRIHIVNLVAGFSTTGLIKKICEVYKEEQK